MSSIMDESPLFVKGERECALCGRLAEMTFEHIPPKAAGNATPVKPITLKAFLESGRKYPWERKGIKYKNQQAGMGVFSLCEECNNHTGHWYGAEYVGWVERAIRMLCTVDVDKWGSVKFEEVYPQRFFKQVLSMFCSINPKADFPDLRAYVLDKDATVIDTAKYRLMMFFTKNATRRLFELSAMGDIVSGKVTLLSEIVVPPFGFALFINSEQKPSGEWFDITPLGLCNYDQKCTVTLPLLFQEVNGVFLGDYRSQSEIIEAAESSPEPKKGEEPADKLM